MHFRVLKRVASYLGMDVSRGIIMLASEILRRQGRGLFCRDKVSARYIVSEFADGLPEGYEPTRITAEKKPQPVVKKKFRAPIKSVIKNILPSDFYFSDGWRAVRYQALRASKGTCVLCGTGPLPGKPLHVDHIKPRSRYPGLELDPDNLQVLCADCNLGKSNTDSIDWRKKGTA
jgi:hypothetical protein